jgi:hypothetical protein
MNLQGTYPIGRLQILYAKIGLVVEQSRTKLASTASHLLDKRDEVDSLRHESSTHGSVVGVCFLFVRDGEVLDTFLRVIVTTSRITWFVMWCTTRYIHILYMWRQKKCWPTKRQHWCHLIGLDSLFQKTLSSPPKTEPFSQEMRLKILLLSQGLKLPNSKPGCIVSTLHFFVK